MPTKKIIMKIRNKLYYLKMVVSLVVLIITVVLTMSIIFSSMYKNALVASTSQEYLDSLNRVNVSIENILKQADSLYTNMQLNKDIFYFLNSQEVDMKLALKAQNEATQTKHLNPYIQSICLYNAGTEFFLSTGYSLKEQEQMDNLFKKSVMNSEIPKKRNIKSLSLDIQNVQAGKNSDNSEIQKNKKTYILSIKYTEFSMDNKLRNSILINLDQALIQRDIFKSLGGDTIIINEDGSILYHEESGKLADQKLITFVFKNANSEGNTNGTLKYGSGVNKHVVTYVKSSMMNWYVINIRPYSNITQTVKNKEILLYVICIALLFAFIGISFFLSSQLYSPIKKVIESLKVKVPYLSDNNNSELPLIANVIEETLKKMNELTHKNDESKMVLKESLLRSLIIMGANEENERNLIQECPLQISFNNLILILVKVDNHKLYKENNAMIIDTIMSTTIKEVVEKDFLCETVHMFQGEICILMNFRNNKSNNFEDLLIVLEEVKGFVHKLIGTTVTIGIGGVANNTAECITAYKKANNMVKYRFVLGTDRVIYERYIEDNLKIGVLYPTELKEKLLVSLKLNKKEEFEDALEQIITLLSKYVYSDVVVIFLKLILDCIETMNEITGRVKRIEFDFEEFNSIFLEFLTLEHAKNWLLRLFCEYQIIMKELDSLEGSKYYKMVEDTKEFIQENCSDINLNIEILAEKMGYSHKYFSKVFKDISGQYLSDYIRQIRITKAKELLCKDEFKINEIVSMTGFVNSSYFYTSFKNEVGMTPSDYKKFYHKNS